MLCRTFCVMCSVLLILLYCSILFCSAAVMTCFEIGVNFMYYQEDSFCNVLRSSLTIHTPLILLYVMLSHLFSRALYQLFFNLRFSLILRFSFLRFLGRNLKHFAALGLRLVQHLNYLHLLTLML